jgi:hypothetical protein
MGSLPAENALEFFLAGDKDGGITGTARTQFARDLATGDALRRIDNFQDREAAAVSNVEGFAGDAVDFLKRADVGIGDIEHVDVIADTGSVRCGVIRAEDIDVRQATGGGIEYPRNEMSFHAMMLAAFLGGSSSIEIAEGHIFESGVELVIRQNLFEHELGFSIGVDRRFPMGFGNGNDFGFAVSSSSGRKNEFLYAVAGDGIEQVHAAGYVSGIENAGFANRFGDQSLGGEVHHGINLVLREDTFKSRAIRKIYLAKDGSWRHGGTMALEQTIQCDDGHAARNQDLRTDAADVTRRSGNENIHLSVLLESVRNAKWVCSKLPEPAARAAEKKGAPARKCDKD